MTSKRRDKFHNKKLLDYLKSPSLFGEVSLCHSNTVKFHWSNWEEYIDHIRPIKRDISILNEIKNVKRELENEPVWLISKRNQLESNTFEIYKYFLDPRLRELWFEMNEDVTMSVRTPQGPYIRLQSLRWFSYSTYRVFVYEKLLQNNWSKKRSLRLSTNLPLNIAFKGEVVKSIEAKVVQIMNNGVLIQVKNKADMMKISNGKSTKLSIDLKSLRKVISYDGYQNSLESFELEKCLYELSTNKKNIGFSNGSEYYLHFSFDQVVAKDRERVKSVLQEVFNNYEKILFDHLNEVKKSEEKEAA